MALAYRIDKARRLTVSVWDGEISADEFRAHIDRIIADPDWPPGPAHLTDMTTWTGPPVATDELLDQVVTAFAESGKLPSVKFAAVATDALDRVRRFERAIDASSIPTAIIVFNELGTAARWLGVDLDAARPALREIRDELRRSRTVEPG